MTKLERIVANTHPFKIFLKKSKKWIPPGFQGVTLYRVMDFFWKQLKISNLTERASAISYNFIMSVPPTCLFIFTAIPALPFVSKANLKRQLHILIDDILPSKIHDNTIITFVNSFIDVSRIGLISFSFILSLFFASNAMMGVMRSFSKNYIGFEKRLGLEKRWVAIKLTMLLFSLVLICLFLLISQSNILSWIGIKSRIIKQIIIYGKWIFIILLVFYSYAFIYKYAPPTQKRWKLLSPGALLATSLSILSTIGFSTFVNNFGRYNVLYGSIGTVIVLMILIFINSFAVLIGFEFNVSINSLRAIIDKKEKGEPVSLISFKNESL